MLKKSIGDSTVVVPLENTDVQNNLSYVEIPVEILDYQIHRLRTKKFPLSKFFGGISRLRAPLGKQNQIYEPSTLTFSPQTHI